MVIKTITFIKQLTSWKYWMMISWRAAGDCIPPTSQQGSQVFWLLCGKLLAPFAACNQITVAHGIMGKKTLYVYKVAALGVLTVVLKHRCYQINQDWNLKDYKLNLGMHIQQLYQEPFVTGTFNVLEVHLKILLSTCSSFPNQLCKTSWPTNKSTEIV